MIRQSFTLIELMIVILIIAVLAALLFPLLGAVIEGSRNTACQNNLRTMYQGVMAYANDHNGCIPAASNTADAKKGWTYDLAKYIAPKAFICPSDNNTDRGEMTEEGTGFENPPYGYNNSFGTSNGSFGPDRSQSTFKNPEKTVLIADVEKFMVGGRSAPEDNRIKERHREMGNVLFLDGHVESNKREFFEESKNEPDNPYIFQPFKKTQK